MNLFDTRVRFIDLTGRYDLVEDLDSYKDAGANYFIKLGCKLLDDMSNLSNTLRNVSVKVSSGDLYVQGVKAIKGISYTDGESKYIVEKGNSGMLNLIPFTGAPAYYVPAGYVPDKGYLYKLFPVPDSEYTLDIWGYLYSPFPETDMDTNIWMAEHQDLLLSAAMYSVERYYRNREAMDDHMEAITLGLQGIDFNEAEQDTTDLDHMEDSW